MSYYPRVWLWYTVTPSHARVPFFLAIQTWNMQDRYRFWRRLLFILYGSLFIACMVHHNTFWILSLMERCILSKSGKSEILLFLIWPGQQLVIWSISPGLQLNHKTAITFGYAYFENDQRLLISTFIMEVRWLSYWLWTMFQRLCGQQLKYKNLK
jgi:hypothetical protein